MVVSGPQAHLLNFVSLHLTRSPCYSWHLSKSKDWFDSAAVSRPLLGPFVVGNEVCLSSDWLNHNQCAVSHQIR